MILFYIFFLITYVSIPALEYEIVTSDIIGKSLKWMEFSSLNSSCTKHGIEYELKYKSFCEPYMTGDWCKAAYTTCPYPFKVLVTENNQILPLLHAFQSSPINACLQELQKQSLVFIFLGDSQTRMSQFVLSRWADKGQHTPQEGLDYYAVNGWTFSNYHIKIEGILPETSSTFTNLTLVYDELATILHAAPASSHVVVFLGQGVWDIVFAHHFNQYEQSYIIMMDKIYDILVKSIRSKRHHIKLYIRNMYVSYGHSGKELGNLKQVNTYIYDAYRRYITSDTGIDNNNSTNATNKKEVPLLFHVKLLDMYSLSSMRREEMPFKGDGLHWGCLAKKRRYESFCHHQLMEMHQQILQGTVAVAGSSGTSVGVKYKRPDEVAWASVQLMLLDLCNLMPS